MKTFLSLPTDNDFFSRYANLVPTLYKLGFFAQIVSGLTESGIIFSMAFASLNSFHWFIAGTFSVLACIIGVGFIEIGLRTFLPYSVRVFLFKRFKGLDLAMSIFILLVAIGLLFLSGRLSFNNSFEIIKTFSPEVEQVATDEANNQYDKERKEILADYRTNSTSTAQGYVAQINAKKHEYQSLVDIEKRAIERYEQKEQRTGKIYKTKKVLIKTEIERLEARRDSEISVLTTYKAKGLKSLLEAKNKDLKEIKNKYRRDIADVTIINNENKAKKSQQVQAYGLGLGWFTIICLIVLVLSVTLHEIHKKGSGITETILASQHDFSTGIVSEFLEVVRNRIQYELRSRILKLEAKTPTLPLPHAPVSLYDLSKLKQDIITIHVEESDEAAKVVYLPNENRYYENRSGDNINNSSKERICLHCDTDYIYNHKKQKYCSDNCRIKAWEQRQETKLTKRKAKIIS